MMNYTILVTTKSGAIYTLIGESLAELCKRAQEIKDGDN